MNLNRKSTELIELPLESIGSDFSECLVETLYMHDYDLSNVTYKVYIPAMVSMKHNGYYLIVLLSSFELYGGLVPAIKQYIYVKDNIPALFKTDGLSMSDYIKIKDGYLVTFNKDKKVFDLFRNNTASKYSDNMYIKWRDVFGDWNRIDSELKWRDVSATGTVKQV